MKIERSTISTKSRGINYYLQEIENLNWIEFDKLTVFSTYGDIRPPYPYQWYTTTKLRPGDDDPFEGVGGTPLEAIRNLYHSLAQQSSKSLTGEKHD